jgi:hypothetical protein
MKIVDKMNMLSEIGIILHQYYDPKLNRTNKTESMILNYKDKYQFSTRLLLNNEIVHSYWTQWFLMIYAGTSILITLWRKQMLAWSKWEIYPTFEHQRMIGKMCISCLWEDCWNNQQQFGTVASLRRTVRIWKWWKSLQWRPYWEENINIMGNLFLYLTWKP